MRISASFEFIDPEPGVHVSTEMLREELAGISDVPEIKFRVPSTEALRQENIISVLKPYEYLIQQLQTILLWKRPAEYAVIVTIVELLFILGYITNMGFMAGCLVIATLFFTWFIVFNTYKTFILEKIFPPVYSEGNLYDLDDIAKFISIVGSRIHCFLLGCKQKAEDMSIISQLTWIFFLVCCFIAFKIIKTYVILYAMVHFVLIIVPLIFHPMIHPRILPSLERLMTTIAPKVKDQ